MKQENYIKLKEVLNSKHLPTKAEWLKTCVDYLEDAAGQESFGVNTMLDLVIHQFLYSDLSDSYDPIMKIPDNAAKLIITKKMIFQVISSLDISLPIYEQLCEETKDNHDLSWFHGVQMDEAEEKEGYVDDINNNTKRKKKKGMRKLELSDGLNNIKAIEIDEDACGCDQIIPGSKIILVGKVKYRRGIIFLDKSNCQMLGGQVEKFAYNMVDRFAKMLKIDLDKESKRRKIALAKAEETRKIKKDKQVKSQSSISPFLMKTNRITGEIKNPIIPPPKPIINKTYESSHFDDFIEDVTPIGDIQSTTKPTNSIGNVMNEANNQNEQQNESSGMIKDTDNSRMEKRKPAIEDWSFSTKKPKPLEEGKLQENQAQIGHTSNYAKTNHKVLSRSLLEDNTEKPQVEKEKTDTGTAEKWKNVFSDTGSNRNTARMSDEGTIDTGIIPQGFIAASMDKEFQKQKKEDIRRKAVNTFTQSIHGPRVIKHDNKEEIDSKTKITQFFNSVKNSNQAQKEKKLAEERLAAVNSMKPVMQQSMKVVEENEEEGSEDSYEQDDEEEGNHEKMVENVRSRGTNYDSEEEEDEEEGGDEEIVERIHTKTDVPALRSHTPSVSGSVNLNCTIENDGRRECERWGLGIDNKRRAEEDKEEEDMEILGKWNPDVLTYKITHLGSNESDQFMRIPGSSYLTSQSGQNNIEFINTKRVENVPKTADTRSKPPCTKKQNTKSLVAVDNKKRKLTMQLKQSSNVQIYKTPMARRVPSSDSSMKFAEDIINRMADLYILPLRDALANRKYWMMSKIVVIMPTIVQQVHELKSDGIDWMLKMKLSDTTVSNVICLVSTDLLNRIFGFTVQQCKQLFDESRVEEMKAKKIDAERKLQGFCRLDLIIWLEVSPQPEKCPLIIDVKTISDALNIL